MKFFPAANYTPHVSPREIDLIVIHTMESPEAGMTAESCGSFFHNQPKGPSGSSAHYGVDNNSIVKYVHDHDVAWAAPGANLDGLHIEHAGRAAQSAEDWGDEYSTDMLINSARLVARKAKRYHVPIRFLSAAEVKAGHSGITGHVQVTESGVGGLSGTHTDPGPNFPWRRYIRYVKAFANDMTPKRFLPGER